MCSCIVLRLGGIDLDLDVEKEILELLKQARHSSGLPLDFWADLTEGLDYNTLAILCGRSSIFPKYINCKDKP